MLVRPLEYRSVVGVVDRLTKVVWVDLEELEAEITKKWEAFRNSELSTIQDTLTKKFATWTEP